MVEHRPIEIGEDQNASGSSLLNLAQHRIDSLGRQVVRHSFPDKASRLRLVKTRLSENRIHGLMIEIEGDEPHTIRQRSIFFEGCLLCT